MCIVKRKTCLQIILKMYAVSLSMKNAEDTKHQKEGKDDTKTGEESEIKAKKE